MTSKDEEGEEEEECSWTAKTLKISQNYLQVTLQSNFLSLKLYRLLLQRPRSQPTTRWLWSFLPHRCWGGGIELSGVFKYHPNCSWLDGDVINTRDTTSREITCGTHQFKRPPSIECNTLSPTQWTCNLIQGVSVHQVTLFNHSLL